MNTLCPVGSWYLSTRACASGSRVDKYTVHTALNHVDENMRVTDIYIRKSWDKIDAANRAVLDFLALDLPSVLNFSDLQILLRQNGNFLILLRQKLKRADCQDIAILPKQNFRVWNSARIYTHYIKSSSKRVYVY